MFINTDIVENIVEKKQIQNKNQEQTQKEFQDQIEENRVFKEIRNKLLNLKMEKELEEKN